MKTYRVWAAAIGLVLSMLWCICPCAAMEGTADIAETYKSYIYDQRGNPVAAPELYRFVRSVSGESLGLGTLSKPADLFTDRNGDIYLADSGNHRILIMDSRLRLEQVIDQVLIDGVPESLNNPQGVFVTADGDLYIADTGNARVLAMRRDGVVFRIYTKPTEAVFPQQTEFSPYKIALDRAGSLYVVCHNVFQGLVSYDAQGTFTGFFGSNPVERPGVNWYLRSGKTFSHRSRGPLCRSPCRSNTQTSISARIISYIRRPAQHRIRWMKLKK